MQESFASRGDRFTGRCTVRLIGPHFWRDSHGVDRSPARRGSIVAIVKRTPLDCFLIAQLVILFTLFIWAIAYTEPNIWRPRYYNRPVSAPRGSIRPRTSCRTT